MPRSQAAATDSVTSEIAILGRVLGNGKEFTAALARHLLRLGFSKEGNSRINDLAARDRQGALSAKERVELSGYADAGCLLGILHAKARRVLGKAAKK